VIGSWKKEVGNMKKIYKTPKPAKISWFVSHEAVPGVNRGLKLCRSWGGILRYENRDRLVPLPVYRERPDGR